MHSYSRACGNTERCRTDQLSRIQPRAVWNRSLPPANRFWFNQSLKPHSFDLEQARRLLAADGFRFAGQIGGQSRGQALRDRNGHAVEFSVITNAGNPARERMAAMRQQDLAAIGIRLNIVTLDFPSLIERIGKSSQYESCLLGNVNVDLDPNGQLNLWLSSSANHQWNPNQAKPATPWEAEIDRLARLQCTLLDEHRRKTLFDRVQQIVWDEAPFLYPVNRNALVAASRKLRNVEPSALRPNLQRADQLAAVDALTGLPNRRALFQRLDAELARCRRSHSTLGLVVFEIDGFPGIRDQSGGQSGVAAARRLWKDIASGLRRICREDDCVARMGEGFVLALGNFSARDLPEKRRLIESILAELAPADAGARPLVPRIGAAYYPDDGAYAEDLLACADLRLNGVPRG